MNIDLLKQNLLRDEGSRLKPYFDTVGKSTIGVGRNLTDKGISTDEQDLMLSNDIKEVIHELSMHIPWWSTLDEVRGRALANMCFNLGIATLLTFRNMLVALQNGQWIEAAKQASSTKWHFQVGIRADRIIHMFETGTDP